MENLLHLSIVTELWAGMNKEELFLAIFTVVTMGIITTAIIDVLFVENKPTPKIEQQF